MLDLFAAQRGAGIQSPLHQVWVAHQGGLIDRCLLFVGKQQPVLLFLQLDLAHIAILQHGEECVVIDGLDLALGQPRHG